MYSLANLCFLWYSAIPPVNLITEPLNDDTPVGEAYEINLDKTNKKITHYYYDWTRNDLP